MRELSCSKSPGCFGSHPSLIWPPKKNGCHGTSSPDSAAAATHLALGSGAFGPLVLLKIQDATALKEGYSTQKKAQWRYYIGVFLGWNCETDGSGCYVGKDDGSHQRRTKVSDIPIYSLQRTCKQMDRKWTHPGVWDSHYIRLLRHRQLYPVSSFYHGLYHLIFEFVDSHHHHFSW